MAFFIPETKIKVNGVGCLVVSKDCKKVFLAEGDRNLWSPGVQEAWAAVFHPIIEDPRGNRVIRGAPFQVITVKPVLELLGRTYAATDQAGAILEYCITKGWFPKCCLHFANRYV